MPAATDTMQAVRGGSAPWSGPSEALEQAVRGGIRADSDAEGR